MVLVSPSLAAKPRRKNHETMIPSFQNTIPGGYEVDRSLFSTYDRSMDLSFSEILRFLESVTVLRKMNLQIEQKIWNDSSPCWILLDGKLPVSFSEARKAQWTIADNIGLLPAKCYEILPDHYDQNFVELYGKLLRAFCIFKQPCCIRPAHLQMCDMKMNPIKTLFTFEELRSIHAAVRENVVSTQKGS